MPRTPRGPRRSHETKLMGAWSPSIGVVLTTLVSVWTPGYAQSTEEGGAAVPTFSVEGYEVALDAVKAYPSTAVDPVAYVQSLLPRPSAADDAYLAERGLTLGAAYHRALESNVEVRGLPVGTWFSDREVVLTVTGPSALVSHLEAQIIWLRFRIQVATMARLQPERLSSVLGVVTCERERDIVLESLEAAQVRPSFDITVDSNGYHRFIQSRAKEHLAVVEDPGRVFEAGMRAASCLEQHRIAVTA